MGEKKKLLVLGGLGMLGKAVCRLAPPEWEPVAADIDRVDITDRESVAKLLDLERPALVINCAAYTNVDGCESNFELADRVNGAAPGILLAETARAGARFLHISTDYVFDGKASTPYSEDDPTGPISAYGVTKLNGEKAMIATGLTGWTIVRTSWLFGPGGKNFVDTMAKLSLEREELKVVSDQTGRPTFTEDLAAGLFALIDAPPGIYHYSNTGAATWHEFTEAVVEEMRLLGAPVATKRVIPIATADYPRAAAPPAYSVMSTEKFARATGITPPHWRDAVKRHLAASYKA